MLGPLVRRVRSAASPTKRSKDSPPAKNHESRRVSDETSGNSREPKKDGNLAASPRRHDLRLHAARGYRASANTGSGQWFGGYLGRRAGRPVAFDRHYKKIWRRRFRRDAEQCRPARDSGYEQYHAEGRLCAL